MFTIFRFELRRVLCDPFLWTMGTCFFLMAAYAGSHNDRQFGHVAASTVNSPANIGAMIGLASIAALFGWGARYIHSILFDISSPLTPLLFSQPFRSIEYVLGKTASAFCAFLLPSVATAIGLLAGVLAPWTERSGLAPTTIKPYVDSLLLLAIPNSLFSCGIVFLFAACARSVFSAYLGFLLLIAVRILSVTATFPAPVSALLDPWGLGAFSSTFIHNTTFDDRFGMPTENALLLRNRLVWTAISTALLMAGVFFIRRARPVLGHSALENNKEGKSIAHGLSIAAGKPRWLSQATAIAVLSFGAMARSWSFVTALFIGIGMLCMSTASNDALATSKLLSTTQFYFELIVDNYNWLIVILLVLFAAEIAFYDETHNTAQMTGAMPVRPGTWLAGKATALVLLTIVLEFAGVATCALLQWNRNPQLFDDNAFTQMLAIAMAFPLLAVAGSAILLAGARSKQRGLAAIAIVVALRLTAQATNSPFHLFEYGWLPKLEYSDFIGFGSQLHLWLKCLTLWVVVLLALTLLVMAIRSGGSRLKWIQIGSAVTALALACAAHTYYWYDEDVMPSGLTANAAVRYERLYSHLANIPQPTVVGITTVLDLDFEKLDASAEIRYRVVNKTTKPIEFVNVDWSPAVEMTIDGVIELTDAPAGFATIRLGAPLPPGESVEIHFSVSLPRSAFARASFGILENNSALISSDAILPHIGYNILKELSGVKARKEYSLPEAKKRHANSPGDDNFLSANFAPSDVDTTIRLNSNLWVIAPGKLLEEPRQAGQRRQFRYATTFPILPYYAVLAGNWEKQSRQVDETNIEVYYHAKHDSNIGKILGAAGAALAYETENLSAYRLGVLRIVEMPCQIKNLQTFPGLVVVPEQGPFLFDSKSSVHDWTTMLVAHEVSHQWWGYKIIPAQDDGAQVILESLAQYSALRVLNKRSPAEKDWFLSDARKKYDEGRRHRAGEEPPLLRASDPYLTYGKGALIMNNLAEELGESRFNAALTGLIVKSATPNDAYVTIRDLEYALLTGSSQREAATIRDAFENNASNGALLGVRQSK